MHVEIGKIPIPLSHAFMPHNASSQEAKRIGLLHEVVAPDELDARISRLVKQLNSAAPGARAIAKKLPGDISGRPIDEALLSEIAALIADVRTRPEAGDGLSAFLEKRKASWI